MRYFVVRKMWTEDHPEPVTPTPLAAVTVYPADAADTGLLDSEGNAVMRGPDQIGFMRLSDG